MKKTIALIISAMVFSGECHAQLKVKANGEVEMGTISSSMNYSFSQSGNISGSTRYGVGINTVSNTIDVVGQQNHAVAMGHWKSSIGSFNQAMSLDGIYNVGIVGRVPLSSHGTLPGNLMSFNVGVFGIAEDSTYTFCPIPLGQGCYAGYFIGDTYVDGALTATSVVTPSDMRLKENVQSLEKAQNGESVLNNIMGMNVIQYNYKDRTYRRAENNINIPEEVRKVFEEEVDILEKEEEKTGKAKELHFGLSAQELEEIFPNLVKEGQDGYLGVNYTELVPVLIRCIQEMQQEIDELKGTDTEMKAKANVTIGETTDLNATATNRNQLFQNRPNPFKEQTEIRFSLADGVKDAAICIFDMQGKMLKSYPVQSDMKSVTVNGYELGAGMFLYSLVVNGQEVDTKKMILSK